MPKKILPKDCAKILYELTAGLSGEQLDQALQVYLDWLRKERALNRIQPILAEFFHYAKQRAGTLPVEIKSARPLTESEQQQISRQLGDGAALTNVVDKRLIGGAILRVGNVIIDGSTKKQLEKLKQQLVN